MRNSDYWYTISELSRMRLVSTQQAVKMPVNDLWLTCPLSGQVIIIIVRLSLLTMTTLNHMREMLLFVCSKIADRPILALNCLLQMEQQRAEQDSSVGDALALALRCACFCSASLILFASYSLAPLLMRHRHFARSCAVCSHDYVGLLKSSREVLRVSLYRFFRPPWERLPISSSP